MKKELVSFVPKPNTLGDHNWCVPYAWATLLGKDYDDVYKDICDCLGRKVRGVYPSEEYTIAKYFGEDGTWLECREICFAYGCEPPQNLKNVGKWIKQLKKFIIKHKNERYFMIHVTGHAMVWDDKLKLIIDNQNQKWVPADKHHNRLKKLKRIGVVKGVNPGPGVPAVKQVGQSDAAKEKKVYYNRVRRTCKKFNILLEYVGEHKNYTGLKIRGWTFAGYMKIKNSDINWKAVHEYLQKKGFKGGVK